jgi:hypothetical protein
MQNNDSQMILQGLERAFRPLRCVAKISDYGDRLHFKVFGDKGETIVGMPEVLVRTIRDPASLDQLIHEVRKRIVAKGYNLDPM